MRNPQLLFSVFLSVSVLSFSKNGLSQHKNRIGISIGIDKASSLPARAIPGISFERMVNKHNSAEIGIYYRSAIDDNLVVLSPYPPNNSISEQFFILEKFISIPLVYNYRSNTVNLSIGPVLDIFTGWKEKKHTTNPPSVAGPPLQSYKFDNKLLWGAIGKISKTLKVNDKLLIEPAVYYNPVFTSYSLYSKFASETRQYYGVVLSAKYVL